MDGEGGVVGGGEDEMVDGGGRASAGDFIPFWSSFCLATSFMACNLSASSPWSSAIHAMEGTRSAAAAIAP